MTRAYRIGDIMQELQCYDGYIYLSRSGHYRLSVVRTCSITKNKKRIIKESVSKKTFNFLLSEGLLKQDGQRYYSLTRSYCHDNDD